MELIDTHCHLDFDSFDADREAVLDRAQRAGVLRVVNPGIDLASSQAAVTLAQVHPSVYAAVGVHPNEAARVWQGEATLQTLRRLAQNPRVVAIGEIGLDYYRDRTPRGLQWTVLRAQLDLAAELSLPVLLHNREATADLLALLREWCADLRRQGHPLAGRPGIWHAFSGDEQAAQQAIDLGFYLGLGGPLTFKNAPERRQVTAALPLERLVLETDAPFLAPHPYRGRRNEPAYVRLVAETLAQIKNLSLETIAQQTTANAATLFGWRETA